MQGRRFLFILVIALIIAFIARPSGFWQEFKRAWSRREWTLRILATIAVSYFLYGLFTMFWQ